LYRTVATTTMEPGGNYDRHAGVQRGAAEFALPLLRRAAQEAALPETLPKTPPGSVKKTPFPDSPRAVVVVADYGSATGKNSLAAVAIAIDALRARTQAPILCFHEDQPKNDFRTLLETIASGSQSYLREHEGVFACAIGKSFYEPVLPPSFVDVGWSSAAAHWMSGAPGPIGELLCAPTPRMAAGTPLWDQARRDWQRFVALRQVELRPGGRMVVVVATVDEDGVCGGEHVYDLLRDAVTRLAARGDLSDAERGGMFIPLFFLPRADLEAPFARGLRLIEHLRIVASDPLWSAFEHSGDAEAFATEFTGWLRAHTEPCLFGALAQRTDAERRRLADQAYGEVAATVRRNPESVRCAWRMAALLFGK
jgi:S-adenosylmethionine-dependent carboxyl methyltransferase